MFEKRFEKTEWHKVKLGQHIEVASPIASWAKKEMVVSDIAFIRVDDKDLAIIAEADEGGHHLFDTATHTVRVKAEGSPRDGEPTEVGTLVRIKETGHVFCRRDAGPYPWRRLSGEGCAASYTWQELLQIGTPILLVEAVECKATAIDLGSLLSRGVTVRARESGALFKNDGSQDYCSWKCVERGTRTNTDVWITWDELAEEGVLEIITGNVMVEAVPQAAKEDESRTTRELLEQGKLNARGAKVRVREYDVMYRNDGLNLGLPWLRVNDPDESRPELRLWVSTSELLQLGTLDLVDAGEEQE